VPAPLLIALVVTAALLLGIGVQYNGLVRRRNRVDSTWSDIDVLLRRRHDLVPNLVSSVQGYATHESATVRSVTEARAAAMSAPGPSGIGRAETNLSDGVRTLIAEAETYPQLKASAAFIDLQDRLTATEDGIEHARQFYNDSVYGYNTAVQTLPGSLIAGPLGFRLREFFQAAGAERSAVQVKT